MTVAEPADDDAGRGHWPGEPALWSLMCSDLILFAAMFISFSVDRLSHAAEFRATQPAMNQGFGFINTLLLLVSSWFVAAAVRAARQGEAGQTRRMLVAAIGLGASFIGVKIAEYHEKVTAGLTPQTNLFYTYYFTLTGIHLFHVLIGLVVLGLLALRYRRSALGPRDFELLESGASFWHLVDLLWIMLFALFYLVR